MSEEADVEQNKTPTNTAFSVGDRVILHGLTSAAHLNGMHGTVGGGGIVVADDDVLLESSPGQQQRYPIDLDLLLPNNSSSHKRLGIQPANLKREPAIISDDVYRAKTAGGSLVEMEGRAMDFVLNAARICASDCLGMNLAGFQDLVALRMQGGEHGSMVQNRLQTSAWTFWTHAMDDTTADPVYPRVVQYIQQDLPAGNGGVEAMKKAVPFYQRCYESVTDVKAVKGWNVRVTGEFFIVDMDEDGTYLVPITNSNLVYQCVGVCDPIYPKIQGHLFPRAPVYQLTMIPWYGRLVYDGVLVSKGSMASPAMDARLRKNVETAKREGRVIQRLAQLEVEGGSKKGVFDQVERTDEGGNNESEEQTPASTDETKYVNKLSGYPLFDGAGMRDNTGRKGGLWVMRRQGYTEQENGDHSGLILSDNHQIIGPFFMSALLPTSTDVLKALVTHVHRIGTMPRGIGIDDKKCCDRVKFLLKDFKDVFVYYYAPPTPEESAAHMAMGDFESNPDPTYAAPMAM